MHSPSSRTRIWAMMLAFTLAVSLTAPVFAAPDASHGVWMNRAASEVLASVWSAWLELWAPVVAWFAPDGTTSSTTDPLSGGGGTGGPGSGGGMMDPNGST